MRLLYRPQLSDANIRALLCYKSSGEDRSVTYRYVLSPIYDILINYVPVTVAPNLITLVGFLCTLIAHVFVVMLPASRRAAGWAGVGQLVYMTLDNLDGRQARRTGSSSPLGHLFDHGLDAINVTLATLTMTTALQLSTPQSFAFVVLAQTGLVACGIEEYVTGRMILREINGPNEGVLALVGNLFITAYFGAPVWHAPVFAVSNIDITPVHIGTTATVLATASTVIPCAIACYRHREQKQQGRREKGVSIFKCLESFLVYLVFFTGWLLVWPNTLAERWICAAWVSSMFVFDYASKLIIAHLTGDIEHLPRCGTSYALFCMILLAFPFLNDSIIYIVGMAAAGCVLWRAICLIHQLCHVLDIHCFKLNSNSKAAAVSVSPSLTGIEGPHVEVGNVGNAEDLEARLRRRS